MNTQSGNSCPRQQGPGVTRSPSIIIIISSSSSSMFIIIVVIIIFIIMIIISSSSSIWLNVELKTRT